MDTRYRCLLCGYTYDPKRGDPKGDIPVGTPGENLPPDWKCPLCRTDLTNFARRED